MLQPGIQVLHRLEALRLSAMPKKGKVFSKTSRLEIESVFLRVHPDRFPSCQHRGPLRRLHDRRSTSGKMDRAPPRKPENI